MEKNTGMSFVKNFFVLGIGTFIYLIVGVIGTPVITRLVDPTDYGRLSMFTVYSNIGMMFCGLGLDQTLVRWFYHDDSIDYKRKLVYECCAVPVILCVCAGFLMILAGPYANGLGLIDYSRTELLLLVINVLALLVHRYAILVVRLRYHTKDYSIVNIIQKVAYILITVCLVGIFQDYYFIILAVATILSTLLCVVVAVLREKEIWNFHHLKCDINISYKELLNYGIPIMFSSGITMIFNALDKLFINHYCTLADVGVYTSAMNLMAVFSIVRTSFNALWMPTAVEHYEKYSDDKEFYRRGNAFIVMLMVTFGAGVILFKDLFVLLLGNKYQEAAEIIPFLMFEPIMYTISETTATGIVVQKKSKYQIIIAAGAFISNFIGNWILTPIMGPRGAALSTGIAYIVFFALRTFLANKVFYINYDLKKFAVVIIALFMFAYYGSVHVFSMEQIFMFMIVLMLLALLYRDYFMEAIQLAKGLFVKVFHRK